MINHPNRSKKTETVLQDVISASSPASPPSEAEPVDRSFSGIRNALFDDWDRLRGGKISTDQAKSSARMADVILGSVETQLEAMRAAKSFGMAPLLMADQSNGQK
jgi:hypothetical protein